ncbi:16S rRNA (guanine(527)-N(7))-methyltransferase RsmG [Lichenihabitans sp. PAMC28606]|uniref:16S rRNA (guanine(527)-N(7))-methyltransferase RsmG n=1 Tax=Lichenihabitans sp. PAMC28606 TaxID=2880932 RepID=UPI001D0B30DC|nr:16S rRNA (guanine(527)-N(7))-methyltransferase RsmG [Lichenihabitans sp. PAMC28606]UDL93501.1 16S rRNA (guanine(527)-N(7))-methyltransferase RsmG [Lichenihabitans sp. PAMC28606]
MKPPTLKKNAKAAIDDSADRAHSLAIVPVSRETEERFAIFVGLLHRWQTIKNLVGPSTLDTVWTRHIADSAQLVALAPMARRWVDLGSGAGFPGIVIGIMIRDLDGARVDLVESNERKCAFLREAVRATGSAARVHMGRIENVLPTLDRSVDVVTSRALAPLPDLIAMGDTLLKGGAVGLFLKGDEALPGETSGASGQAGDFAYETIPSKTHPHARIVRVRTRD